MFCGLSTRQLCGGANGYLLQEGLCHMLHDSGLPQPELLSPWQATADPCLHRRHLNTQRQVWLSLCGVSGSSWAQGFVQALQASLEGKLGLILNVIFPLQPYCWDFLFALEHGASFFFFLVKSNILLSMIVQQWVAILEFSQDKMSAHPSTLPSSKLLSRVQNGTVILKDSWLCLTELSYAYRTIQQLHPLIFTQKSWKLMSTQKFAYRCSY